MAAKERLTLICVDFGMTGSAFMWKDSITSLVSSKVPFKKSPTKIVFPPPENKEGQLAVQESQHNNLPAGNTKECFKVFMDVKESELAKIDIPGAPESQIELHSWVREYLRDFCSKIVRTIDRSLPPDWKKAKIQWRMTVPGSWDQVSVAADFERLAREAIYSFLPKETNDVCTTVTEAHASAMCLLVDGLVANNKAYDLGCAVISCDIGGATTDVAVSRVCGPGRLVPFVQFQSKNPLGFVILQKEFFLHVIETLRSAGVCRPKSLAETLVRDQHTTRKLQEFTGEEDKQWLEFKLPVDCPVGHWQPSQRAFSKETHIRDFKLRISRQVIAGFFDKLAEEIEDALDEAVRFAIEEGGQPPDIIGFCGGVSNNVCLMKRLGDRSKRNGKAVVDFKDLSNPPEMAAVIGNYMLCDQAKLETYISNTRFGIQVGDYIKWGTVDHCTEPSTFKIPFAWVVTFDCEKHKSLCKHRIFALSIGGETPSPEEKKSANAVLEARDISLPDTVQEALGMSRCTSWNVEVVFSEEKGPRFSWKRKFKIVLKIFGVGEVETRAYNLSGAEIGCKVIE